MKLGRLQTALQHMMSAVAFFDANDSQHGATVNHNIAAIYLSTGAHSDALTHQHRALAHYTSLSDPFGMAMVLDDMAYTHALMKYALQSLCLACV